MSNQLPLSTWITTSALSLCLLTSAAAQSKNPIALAARLLDPELVRVEDRLGWLQGRLDTISTAQEHALKTSIGHRGRRMAPTDPPPSVTLDLGDNYPISMIYLVPAQGEFVSDPGMFPSRLTLECAQTDDFANSTIIYQTTGKPEEALRLSPMAIPAENISARFLRLTVQQGVYRSGMDVFALSEIVVMSDAEPVSFGAKVSSIGALVVEGIWHHEALVDGRTPFGIWQNGINKPVSTGDVVFTKSTAIPTTWTLSLSEAQPIDRLVLFPYEINKSLGTFVFPESIRISLRNNGKESADHIWVNPLPGGTHLTPLVIPFRRLLADEIIIHAEHPWAMGDQLIHAFSEIEVWSNRTNLSYNRQFRREHNGVTENTTTLSDGFTSVQQIIDVGNWFQQLHDRHKFGSELEILRPIQRSLEANSELNASWASAVLVGLTFLIPVFIVERRRLTSKENLNIIRKRIASDLHDDIGSNLGSISLIARSARKDLIRLHGPEVIANDLNEVESIARESSLAMRDIVWLLERKQDTIGDLYQRMRETANRLLREIEFTIHCDSTKTTSRLSLDAKRHLFLFFKEAIHNILKHSHATQVSIRIWDEDEKLALEISDNGIGIQSKSEQPVSNLAKLEDRAHILGGEIHVTSSKPSGTSIRLVVKRSLLNTQRQTKRLKSAK